MLRDNDGRCEPTILIGGKREVEVATCYWDYKGLLILIKLKLHAIPYIPTHPTTPHIARDRNSSKLGCETMMAGAKQSFP